MQAESYRVGVGRMPDCVGVISWCFDNLTVGSEVVGYHFLSICQYTQVTSSCTGVSLKLGCIRSIGIGERVRRFWWDKVD